MVRQLDMFQKHRPKAALEFRTCCALAMTIDYLIRPQWKYSHLPFGESRSAITGARLKRLGTKRGWPDYIFIGPHGSTFWMEVKRDKLGRLSEAQLEFAAHAKASGHDYACVTSYEQAIEALVSRNIIRPVTT